MSNTGRPFRVALLAERREDHDLVTALLSQYPRSRFDLEVFSSEAAGREAVAARRFDAFVVDAALAGRCLAAGEEAAKRPREFDLFSLAVSTGRPVIILADENEAEGDETWVAAGAWDCLVKFTLTPPLLARTLMRGIEHGRLLSTERRRADARRIDALSRLAGGMAHDFNNLLTAMLGYAELLRESLDPGDIRRQDAIEIQRAGERASLLTSELLTYACRKPSNVPPTEIDACLDAVRDRLQPLLGEERQLVFARRGPLYPVSVEPARLEELLAHLATNARDAMPSGGRFRVEAENVDLDELHAAEHPGSAPGPHVLLTAADDGLGMSSDAMSHLFEPFFTTKTRGKGTGLGLAVVLGIVRQAGGHIDVESRPGMGTTFRIYLPAGTRG